MPKHRLMTRQVYLNVSLAKSLKNKIQISSDLCSIHENHFCDIRCNFEQQFPSEIIQIRTFKNMFAGVSARGRCSKRNLRLKSTFPRKENISDIIMFHFHPFYPSNDGTTGSSGRNRRDSMAVLLNRLTGDIVKIRLCVEYILGLQ